MITGVILAHNEERNIVDCIEALRPHVSELLLIDAESVDRTRELAAPLVDRIIAHPNAPNFDAIRNVAIGEAAWDWMWFVDADERVPEATGRLVNRLIRERGEEFEGICIPFKTQFCGQWMQHCGWWPGYTCPRVLKRGHFQFAAQLHGGVELHGRELKVPADPSLAIDHHSYLSIEHYLRKSNRYTDTESLQLAERGVRWDWREANRAFARDLWEHYEYHDARSDGDRGWVLTWLAGMYRWLSFAKLIDRQSTYENDGGISSTPESLDVVLAALADDLAEYRATAPERPLGLIARVDFADEPLKHVEFVKRLIEMGRQTRLESSGDLPSALLTASDRLLFQALRHAIRPKHAISIAYDGELRVAVDPSAVLNILFVAEERAAAISWWPEAYDHFNEVWVLSETSRQALREAGAAKERLRIVDPFGPHLGQEIDRLESTAVDVSSKGRTDGPRVEIQGEFFADHSFSNLNEQMAVSLAEDQAFDLSLLRYQGQLSGDGYLRTNADRRNLNYVTLTPYLYQPSSTPDIVIRHAFPPNWSKPIGKWVHIQPWEFGVLPDSWKGPLINDVDEIWVMSRYVEEVYLRSGVPRGKLHYVPWGVDCSTFSATVVKRRLPTKRSFRFLFVGGTIERKGFDRVLDAYLAEFGASDDVALVVKDVAVYAIESLRDRIFEAANTPGSPELLYFDREMTPSQLASLYASCHCLVAPYRGEGFGLPILEAMATGLCPIVPNLGPAPDYADDDCAIVVPSRLVPLNLGDDVPDATEIDISIVDLRAAMRAAYDNRRGTAERGRVAAERVNQRFTWRHTMERIVTRLQAIADRPPVTLTAVVRSDGACKRLIDSLALCSGFDRIVVVSSSTDPILRIVVDEYGASLVESLPPEGSAANDNWTVVLTEGEYLLEPEAKAIVRGIEKHPADYFSLRVAGRNEVRVCRFSHLHSLLATDSPADGLPLECAVRGAAERIPPPRDLALSTDGR